MSRKRFLEHRDGGWRSLALSASVAARTGAPPRDCRRSRLARGRIKSQATRASAPSRQPQHRGHSRSCARHQSGPIFRRDRKRWRSAIKCGCSCCRNGAGAPFGNRRGRVEYLCQRRHLRRARRQPVLRVGLRLVAGVRGCASQPGNQRRRRTLADVDGSTGGELRHRSRNQGQRGARCLLRPVVRACWRQPGRSTACTAAASSFHARRKLRSHGSRTFLSWEDGYNADPLIAENAFEPGDGWRTYRFELRGDAIRLIVDGVGIVSGSLDAPLEESANTEAGIWSQGVDLHVRSIEIFPLPDG